MPTKIDEGDENIMRIFAIIIFAICAGTGLVEFLVAFFGTTSIDEPHSLANQKMRIKRGLWSFSICTSECVFLLTGLFEPIVLLITGSLLLGLGFALSRVNLREML